MSPEAPSMRWLEHAAGPRSCPTSKISSEALAGQATCISHVGESE
jgi:hypothetical protein